MRPITPKLSLPLRLDGTGFAAVEQDSVDEVEQCVEAILRTPIGDHIDDPELGVPDVAFRSEGIAEDLLDAIAEWEPRATIVISEDRIIELAEHVVQIRLDPEEN